MKTLTMTILGLLVALPALAATSISGRDLAVKWPALLGETVQVRVTPVRALAAGKYHVRVDAEDAVLIMTPSKAWTGKRTVCASVFGPESIANRGKTTVVGLMLTECE